MFAIVELKSPLFRELEEQFIDDAGRLQQIGGRLAAEKRSGDLPQTRVDKGEKRVEGGRVTITPAPQQQGDIAVWTHKTVRRASLPGPSAARNAMTSDRDIVQNTNS
jgi:hypothetical protein